MSNYSEIFTLTVSASVADIAAKVGKGFDPDVGGENSFKRNIIGANGMLPVYGDLLTVSTPCTPEFKAQGEYLMTDANALYQALAYDYSQRWEDLTPPTLAECQAFIAAIIPEADKV